MNGSELRRSNVCFFGGFDRRWLRIGIAVVIAMMAVLSGSVLAAASSSSTPADCKPWPEWDVFKQSFVSEGGRVVNGETARKQTVSEGQAYALFFALVANDRASFDKVLKWTENNLAQGDLTAHLPAWQWGHRDDDSWGVLDGNSAADADLWLAYTLGEAGRLWREPRYTALAALTANRVLRSEVADAAKLGPVLMPGQTGFQPDANTWRLNPSYVPLFLLRRMAADYPGSPWPKILETSMRLLLESAPKGFAPDWILYRAKDGFVADVGSRGVGSYDAIRVYLWAGMLAAKEPLRAKLLAGLNGMSRLVAEQGVPPESVDTVTGKAEGVGSSGFSAALLPFFAAQNKTKVLTEQLQRIQARPIHDRPTAYYDHVLALFGLGWHERRFAFAADGSLLTPWKASCAASP